MTTGSPQWGSLLEGLDASRLVVEVLKGLEESKLLASRAPIVELRLGAWRGKSGGVCRVAILSVKVADDGLAGLEPEALRSLADRLELMGLDVAGLRSGDGYIEFVLRVEKDGDCD